MNHPTASQHLFFRALQQELRWLEHLESRFKELAKPSWAHKQDETRRFYGSLFFRLSHSLSDVLDDTPTESFLFKIELDLQTYRRIFLQDLIENRPETPWLPTLTESCFEWGRQLAAERMRERIQIGPHGNPVSLLDAIDEMRAYVLGGPLADRKILLVRRTASEVLIENLTCAHRTTTHLTASEALHCFLEAKSMESFFKGLNASICYHRRESTGFCTDRITWI